ncbi:MAG TPA: bifunctional rhamnulose-1-phosphate aldolase/short-chain dehydrogenase [Candidatus Acidoferrum sp.]|jgi:rhamnose utilization protein RhaD (predicted bifunctional aldolase and dehydrogenase)/NAD(P)-dependent dehydrogenase (short-subunit alcohol dehydrogenase family)|nr:bifunctional rhamnulose-1-phosphate aldolase/short-chain dehydrogenase [Candidatus Acidoferrum sp.]
MKTLEKLRYLEDRWDDKAAEKLDGPDLLRYRSNLLGSDLRITNFGGGNTSSKLTCKDPLDNSDQTVLWIKGSGGDIGSIQRSGFATLYLKKLHSLERRYRGVEFEDEMVGMYPMCTFGENPVAASIDTSLHGFLPFEHIDHLHPDWGIALAAAANGREKMEEFNKQYGHKLVWLPWQRPGFELGMMLRKAVEDNPGCDGIVLGGHGLFTWGNTQRECYVNTVTIIDQLGQFVMEHVEKKGNKIFGGQVSETLPNHRELAIDIFPYIRGRVSVQTRLIGHFNDLPEVEKFVNSADVARLAHLGTSCPDHFIRTKIRPLFVAWKPAASLEGLRETIDEALKVYRKEYAEYYKSFAGPESPAMRDPNPTVVLVPGIGMFSFAKDKTEARITGEFYTNAIHVMEGATALSSGARPKELPQAGRAAKTDAFTVHENYVALPPSEAFRIEYWALEEAKIRRRPPEKELSRRVAVLVGGGNGIGRATAQLAARRGAHIVVADRDTEEAKKTSEAAKKIVGKEASISATIDIRERGTIKKALREAIATYGGIDILINTAAIFPSSADGIITDAQWDITLDINVTANHRLTDEAAKILKDQDLDSSIVLTSSANAVVPKKGSEAYDVSKAAVNHLVRELAIVLSPKIRVNGISPATVVKGSTMFPRDRVITSLTKYGISFDPNSTDDQLRMQLAEFYAKRTLTHQAIDPDDCAQALLFLAGPYSRCTTGHIIPVDGGLSDAFLR